jgi:hypothetical protein
MTIGHTVLAIPGVCGFRNEDVYRVTSEGAEILYTYLYEFLVGMNVYRFKGFWTQGQIDLWRLFARYHNLMKSRLSFFMFGAVLVQMWYHSTEIMDRMDIF